MQHPEVSPHRDTEGLRRAAFACLEAAIHAADARQAVLQHVRCDGDVLWVADERYELSDARKVFVVGGGKAAAAMAAGLEEALGDRIDAGVVCVKHGYGVATRRVRVLEAGHPLPDAGGVSASAEILRMADEAREDDLVFVLLSGGGSALLVAPAEGVSLDDKLAVTRLLLNAGAPIGELNTVRKHLSRIKGGRLARRIAPARGITLILSDVLSNPLDVIASGPTVPDPTTYADALAVLAARGLMERLPAAVLAHLQAGAQGEVDETPKPGDPAFSRALAVIVGDLHRAVEAAAAKAREHGFNTIVLSMSVEGEAREVGSRLGRAAREAAAGRYGPPPVCLLQGGETTVTVRGSGRGGRNQEVALAAAMEIDGMIDVVVLSAGTDGTDGPTDAAGAVVDGETITRARALGLDPRDHLARNDSYAFFNGLGDLIVTGPTRTNVNDLMLALVDGNHGRVS